MEKGEMENGKGKREKGKWKRERGPLLAAFVCLSAMYSTWIE